ncbi:hypothetical protein ACN47E_009664 [Coniothyrium glycines]
MARSHSTRTASPTRFQSPQHSPARNPSQDGSQYEMDLDALGLNSTFESTELGGNNEPPVDRVDTSEIEGPEDFTMNMTYWMTADLPLAQIKSRKEARTKISEIRMDAIQAQDEPLELTEEGDQAIVEDHSPKQRDEDRTSSSRTVPANGTTDERVYSTPASERSMENDEKVRSFLSALPDTDMEGALTGTPLHMQRNSFLQIPRSSPPKARSLQPTVEDYDTPRKPTQETVIHHNVPTNHASAPDAANCKIAELQAQLERQELASRTRITELETILSYTRAELDESRTERYHQKEKLAAVEERANVLKSEHQDALAILEVNVKMREDALETRMREFGEEARLQNLAKLQNQRDEFEFQIRSLEKSKEVLSGEAQASSKSLKQVQMELLQLREAYAQKLEDSQRSDLDKQQLQSGGQGPTERDHVLLSEQLSSVQARANELQSSLDKALTDARTAREIAERAETARETTATESRVHKTRIAELETQLQTARFELECAQADVAAKQQLFNTNMDLNARLRTAKAELETARADLESRTSPSAVNPELESRVKNLMTHLDLARKETSTKEAQVIQEMEQRERFEQGLNTAQGRIEGLESTVANLRQQLAEAHRNSSKVKTDVERLEADLENVNDRLQASHDEADRRVADINRKLSKLKESKQELEKTFKELQSQHEDLVEGNEAMMEDVRDKAEDAVRKAGALLEQERTEKRRVAKDLKKSREEVVRLQNAAVERLDDEDSEDSDDDATVPFSPAKTTAKDAEIASLKDIIRNQITEVKTLKSEVAALKKDNTRLRNKLDSSSDLASTIASLETQLETLGQENTSLEARLSAQAEDFTAINKAMDEKLAAVLSKVVKERARTVVGKRDGQWVDTVSKVQTEKELMSKVLLRQWGREEVGIADETRDEKQAYRYKYVQRS